MRKTQLALAAVTMAASSAAMAQVTLYGAVDAAVVKSDSGTLLSGGGEGNVSYWGIRGSEDLGSGLKASFQLEDGINFANQTNDNGGGASTTSVFNRASFIALGGGFGQVALGNQFNPYVGTVLTGAVGCQNLAGCYVPAYFLTGLNPFSGGGTSTNAFFVNDTITYTTPDLGGLSATVMNKRAANNDATRLNALSASYAVGGVNLSAGTMHLNADRTETSVAANTTISGISVGGSYVTSKSAAQEQKGYLIGASFPLVENLSAGVNYAQNDATTKVKQINVNLKYTLSKSTSAYLLHSNFDNATVRTNSGVTSSGDSVTTIGLQHLF